jgi:hypothetical protein
MTVTLDVHTEETITLEEFVDYVQRELDVTDGDSLRSAAPRLLALSNNRSLVVDRLNEQLRGWQDDFQSSNTYSSQTLMLYESAPFIVRANIWTPLDASPARREQQERLFLYSVAHDHNFDLLTVGHHGPGYETDLYEYDRASVVGLPGESVDLVSHGRERLGLGSVMFYRAMRDVHAQLPPEAFSISINLMGGSRALSLEEQYFFDVEKRAIQRPVEMGVANRVFLCEAARYFGDSRTMALLEHIAERHPSGRTRSMAIESLASLDPTAQERLWTRAADDRDPYVSSVARRRLADG